MGQSCLETGSRETSIKHFSSSETGCEPRTTTQGKKRKQKTELGEIVERKLVTLATRTLWCLGGG